MMVDDAHASGVLGRGGRGTIDHFNCHGRVHIQVGTLSKAIGSMGGYAFGSRAPTHIFFFFLPPLFFFLSSPPRPPGNRGALPGGFRTSRFRRRRKTRQKAVGQYQIFQKRVEEARLSVPDKRKSDPSDSCRG